jgi:hypothetical protein
MLNILELLSDVFIWWPARDKKRIRRISGDKNGIATFEYRPLSNISGKNPVDDPHPVKKESDSQ